MENIEFMLVEPRQAGNVGAAARALFNTGFERLSLIGWDENIDARRTAIEWATDGEPVLANARRCESLEEAVAECGLVIGTAARQGADRPPPLSLDELIETLERWTPNNRVAIVFGPERTGLRTEHIKKCGHTFMIPTASAPRSLNLAQAVLLTGYEIMRAANRGIEAIKPPPKPLDRTATRAEREQLRKHAEEALQAATYLRPEFPDYSLDLIERMLDRAAATAQDVRILHGMCRSVLWAVKNQSNSDTEQPTTEP